MKKAKPHQKKPLAAPAPETKKPFWGVNFTICSILAGMVLLMVFFVNLTSVSQQRHALGATVEKLRVRYHLNDEQAAAILQIELRFHGNGSLFSMAPTPTEEEVKAHHLEISHFMAPAEGMRFVEDHRRAGAH